MNTTLILLCIGGLVLHFLGRYGEFWRTGERVWPHTYVMQDLPGWLSAAIGTAVCMLMLPDLPQLLGITGDVSDTGIMRLAALSAGYMGSSIAAKVPAFLTGKGVR